MNMPNVSAPPRDVTARVPHLPGMAALLAVSLSHIRDIFLLHATLFLLGERTFIFIPQHFLLNQRAFFIHFWWESRMKLQWTLLRTLSRDPVTTFTELTSVEVRRRTTTILSSDFTLKAELTKSFSQLQKIPSTRRSMKWPGIKTTGAQFVYLFNDKMLTATIPCKGALLRARWTYTGNKTRRL